MSCIRHGVAARMAYPELNQCVGRERTDLRLDRLIAKSWAWGRDRNQDIAGRQIQPMNPAE